jgi:phosphoserine phosphatase
MNATATWRSRNFPSAGPPGTALASGAMDAHASAASTPAALLALGAPLNGTAAAEVSALLGRQGISVRARTQPGADVAQWALSPLSGEALAEARHSLDGVARASGVDLVLLPCLPGTVPVRLVVMDMDSTLVRVEVIDELARAHGVVEAVSRITERAMQGELDYDTSLRLRLELLRGLPLRVLEDLAAHLPLHDGAEALLAGLRRAGVRTAVVSGGFDVAARALAARLGIDEVRSNRLEVQGGKLTGAVVGEVVNGHVKRATLERLAAERGITPAQVVAVGDGANDIPMLEAAGLGVAFRAKPRVRAAADAALDVSGLDGVLWLAGLSR